jgi:hypothetical protein
MTALEKGEYHRKIVVQLTTLYATELASLGTEPVAIDADNPTESEGMAIAAYQKKKAVLREYGIIVNEQPGAAKLVMPIYEAVYDAVGDGTDAEILTALTSNYNVAIT